MILNPISHETPKQLNIYIAVFYIEFSYLIFLEGVLAKKKKNSAQFFWGRGAENNSLEIANSGQNKYQECPSELEDVLERWKMG